MIFLVFLAVVGLCSGAPQGGQDRRGNPNAFQREREPLEQRQPIRQPAQTQPPRGAGFTRTSDEPLRILRFDNVNNGDGSYNYGYETENGISVGEEGVRRPSTRSGDVDPITAVKGFFQYFAPEGQQLRVDYTADERGFDARGEHLPTPPPIPEAIMKSLAIVYANAEKQKQLERNEQNRNRF